MGGEQAGIPQRARAADVGLSTVQEVGKIDGEPRVASTLQWRSDARDEALVKMRAALEEAGITIPAGIGSRGRATRKIAASASVPLSTRETRRAGLP